MLICDDTISCLQTCGTHCVIVRLSYPVSLSWTIVCGEDHHRVRPFHQSNVRGHVWSSSLCFCSQQVSVFNYSRRAKVRHSVVSLYYHIPKMESDCLRVCSCLEHFLSPCCTVIKCVQEVCFLFIQLAHLLSLHLMARCHCCFCCPSWASAPI